LACVDSLVFDLSGRVPDEFTLEATSPDGSAWLVRCAGGDAEVTGPQEVAVRVQCRPGSVVFFEFAPEEISLRITWGGAEIERAARPDYEAVRPNGPDCPPECRAGHVAIEFP
jgi:hypothetical protein